MKMKRIIALSLTVLMLAACFAGCGGKAVNLADNLANVNKTYSDATKGLTELTDKADLNKYYQIEVDDVKQFAAEINTDSSTAPVEIVAVEATDADAAKDVQTKLQARFDSIVGLYASYSAEQYDMVKKCAVTTNGNFVIMIVAENYSDILKTLTEGI